MEEDVSFFKKYLAILLHLESFSYGSRKASRALEFARLVHIS